MTWKEKYNKKYGYSKDQSHSLSDISVDTGISEKGLQEIYNKGIGAWKTNIGSVRLKKDFSKNKNTAKYPRKTRLGKEQWAMARVYSAVMGGKASKVDKNELQMEKGGSINNNFDRADFYEQYYKNLSPKNVSVKQKGGKIEIDIATGGAIDTNEHLDAIETIFFKKGGKTDFNPDGSIKDKIVHSSGDVGGMLVGKRHSEGGIKAINKSTGQPLEMEGGEVVITRDAVSDKQKRMFNGKYMTNREILSAINVSGGGVSFADGGEISEEQIDEINQLIAETMRPIDVDTEVWGLLKMARFDAETVDEKLDYISDALFKMDVTDPMWQNLAILKNEIQEIADSENYEEGGQIEMNL